MVFWYRRISQRKTVLTVALFLPCGQPGAPQERFQGLAHLGHLGLAYRGPGDQHQIPPRTDVWIAEPGGLT